MPIMQSAPGARTVIDGRSRLYFAGTSYLGLHGDERVIEAACDAARRYGIHTATSRAGFGENPLTLAVEQAAARFFQAEDAFYFVTGYAGSMALMQSAGRMFSLVLVDSLAHFSVNDGALMMRAPVVPFLHGDADHLRDMFKQHAKPGQPVMVLCDGVSPVLGDIAPVHDYLEVIGEQGGATLCVDDAHGVGVLGVNGRGTLEHAGNLAGKPIAINGSGWREGMEGSLLCATLSKAMGGFGGIIPGPSSFISEVKAGTHWFNGASAPPAPIAGATAKALEILINEPQLRQKLHANVSRLKAGLRSMGHAVQDTPVPIICLELGDAANMRRIQQALMERDIAIAYASSYSGVGPQGALRIAVCAAHTDAMIDQLLAALRETC